MKNFTFEFMWKKLFFPTFFIFKEKNIFFENFSEMQFLTFLFFEIFSFFNFYFFSTKNFLDEKSQKMPKIAFKKKKSKN